MLTPSTRPCRSRSLQPPRDELRAPVGEAHAVDDGLGLGEAEDARAGIAALRADRHGADFDVAEAERSQAAPGQPVLVVARGQTERVGKVSGQTPERPRAAGRAGTALRSSAATGGSAPDARSRRRSGYGRARVRGGRGAVGCADTCQVLLKSICVAQECAGSADRGRELPFAPSSRAAASGSEPSAAGSRARPAPPLRRTGGRSARRHPRTCSPAAASFSMASNLLPPVVARSSITTTRSPAAYAPSISAPVP